LDVTNISSLSDLKILLINYEYPPCGGGAGNATRYLARELRELGHEIAVLTGGKSGEQQIEGVRVIRVGSARRREDRSSLWEMASFVLQSIFWITTKKGKGWKVAIIFFGLPCGVFGPILRMIRGADYIISLRGGDVPGFEPSLNTLHKLLSPLRRFIYKKSKAIVANSESLAALSAKSDPFLVSVIPNGVADDDFFPIDKPSPGHGSSLNIIMASRFHEQKNIPETIERLARARHRGLRFRLTLIGDGPDKHNVERAIQKHKLRGVVTLLGWVSRSALVGELQRADCFLSLSRYEGMPNAMLEAMACGLPVIASKIAPHEELIIDDVEGFLVDLDSDRGLEKVLLRLSENPRQARLVGANACEKVRRRFSWHASAKLYLALVESYPGIHYSKELDR
jgi:glycosyltransferase involved in cell wall biosynthesis